MFWEPFDSGVWEFLLAASIVIAVAAMHVRGSSPRRYERTALLVLADLVLQLLVVAFGLALVFEPDVLTRPGERHARRRRWATCCSRSRSCWWRSAGSTPPRASPARWRSAGAACGG